MSKIIRVHEGDYKVIVRENGAITLYTGTNTGAGSWGSGQTIVSGRLTVDGGNLHSTNDEFNLLNTATTHSSLKDGPTTINAFDINTGTTQRINIGTSADLTTQTAKVFDVTNVSSQTITIGSSDLSTEQFVELANSTVPTQNVSIASGTTSVQQVSIAKSTNSLSQDLTIGAEVAPVSTVKLGNTTSTTRQDAELFLSATPVQTILIGSLNPVKNNNSQTISVGSSSSSVRQDFSIGVSVTPIQDIAAFNTSSSTRQVANLLNSSTPLQQIHLGNSIADTQQLEIGNVLGNTSQTVLIANSSSSTSNTVRIANVTTPTQVIELGVSNTSLLQTVSIANTAGLQTVNIGTLSTLDSTYNIATGPTAAARTKTVNLGSGGVAGSTTNVNIATGVGTGGTTTIGSATIVGEEFTQNLWNSVAKTVNAFGEATEINIGFGTKAGDGRTTIRHDVEILGDLIVQGDTTTINTETLTVEDKNIQLAFIPDAASRSDLTANGGGITLVGTTDKTLNWYNATSAWTSSEHLDLLQGKVYRIENVEVLSPTGVLNFTPSVLAFDTATNVTISSPVGTTNIRNALDVDKTIEVGEDIFPTTTDFSNLGTDTLRFKKLFLTPAGIELGLTNISSAPTTGVVTVDNSIVVNGNGDFEGENYLKVPAGPTESRPGEAGMPTSEPGQLRFNTTEVYFEGYDGVKWKRLGIDIDSTEQYGSLSPLLMDTFEAAEYRSCEYTIQMQDAISTHTVKINVTHNRLESTYTKSLETILGAKCAEISTKITNGNVEVWLTPYHESIEVMYSRVLLNSTSEDTVVGKLQYLPADDLDTIDLQFTSFNIDLTTKVDSEVDLNLTRIPGVGGILPFKKNYGTAVLDAATTAHYIDLEISRTSNLINNNSLATDLLSAISTSVADEIDLETFNEYLHPALSPVVM